MVVRHIIEDIEKVFAENPHSKDFDIAFASYADDGTDSITVDQVEAYHWDDDEFFLVPSGAAHLYELEASAIKAGQFLNELKNLNDEEIFSFETFARAKIKTLEDGSTASLNSPLWGTGIHHDARLIYFYHGKQP